MENPACTETYETKLKNGFAIYQVGAGMGGTLVKNKLLLFSTLNILLI
jgi:hypothetical protein